MAICLSSHKYRHYLFNLLNKISTFINISYRMRISLVISRPDRFWKPVRCKKKKPVTLHSESFTPGEIIFCWLLRKLCGKFAEIVSLGEWLSLSVLLPVNSGRCSYKNLIVRQFHAYLLCTMRMKRPYAFKHRLNGIWSFNKGWLWKVDREDTPILSWKSVLPL